MNNQIDENSIGLSNQGGDKTSGVVGPITTPSASPVVDGKPSEVPLAPASDAVPNSTQVPVDVAVAPTNNTDAPVVEPKTFTYDEPLKFDPNDEKIQQFGEMINKSPQATAIYLKQNASNLEKMAEDLGFGKEHVPEMVSVIRSYSDRNLDFRRALEMDTKGFKYSFLKPAVDTASFMGSNQETRFGFKQFFDNSAAVSYTAILGATVVGGALYLGAPFVASMTALSMGLVGAMDLIYQGAKAISNKWDNDVQSRPEGVFVTPEDNRTYTDSMAGGFTSAVGMFGAGIGGWMKSSKAENGNSSNTVYTQDINKESLTEDQIYEGGTYDSRTGTARGRNGRFQSAGSDRTAQTSSRRRRSTNTNYTDHASLSNSLRKVFSNQEELDAFWNSGKRAYTQANDVRDSDYHQELEDLKDLILNHAMSPSERNNINQYTDDLHKHYMGAYDKATSRKIPRVRDIKRPHPREGLTHVPDDELGTNIIQGSDANVSAQNVIKGYSEHGQPVLQLANPNRINGGNSVYSPLREIDPEEMKILPYSKGVDKEVSSTQPIGFGGHVTDNLAPWQAKRGTAIYPIYKDFQDNIDKVSDYIQHSVQQTKGSTDLNARFVDNTEVIKEDGDRAYVFAKDENNHLSNAISNLISSKRAERPLTYMMNLNKTGDNDTGTLSKGNIGEVASSFITRELARKGINPDDLKAGIFSLLDTDLEDLYNIKHMNKNTMLPVFDIFNENDRVVHKADKNDGTFTTANDSIDYQFVSPFKMLAHDSDEPMVQEVYNNIQFKTMLDYIKGSFIEKDFRSAIVSMVNTRGSTSTVKDEVGGPEVNFNIYSRFRAVMEGEIEDRVSAGITGNYLIGNVSNKLRKSLIPNHDVVENPILIDPALTYMARKVSLPRIREFSGKPFDEASLTDEEWDKGLSNYLMNWLVMHATTSPTHFGDSNYSNSTGLSKDPTSRPLSHIQFRGNTVGVKAHGLQSAGMMDLQILSKFIGDHKFLNKIISNSNGRYVINTKKSTNEDVNAKGNSLTNNIETDINGGIQTNGVNQ